MKPLSEQVRQAVKASGMTNGEIARALGIDKANLGRALRGEQRLSGELMDALGELLNLRVVDGSASARKRDAA
jgi:transcriptional regulator with XRE-family HTH domain